MPVTALELESLASKAIAAKGAAYCESFHRIQYVSNCTPGPYSKFRVGACVLTASGEFVVGANVENVAYPVGTCAERVALGTAIVRRLSSFYFRTFAYSAGGGP